MSAEVRSPHACVGLVAPNGAIEAAARGSLGRVRRSSLRRHDPDQVRRVFLSPRLTSPEHPRFWKGLKHEARAMASVRYAKMRSCRASQPIRGAGSTGTSLAPSRLQMFSIRTYLFERTYSKRRINEMRVWRALTRCRRSYDHPRSKLNSLRRALTGIDAASTEVRR